MLTTFMSSACSLLLADGPPPLEMRTWRFVCTRSPAYPVLDGVAAAASLIALQRTTSKSDADYEGQELSRSNTLTLDVGLLALFTTSAIVGANEVGQCRTAMAEQDRRVPPTSPRPVAQ